ncbi:Guanosine polyphosphate pyrophosphohydrolases/synthetases [Serratia quinivorans]|uniref:RelA/SpoT domain-containing protein n=1 Tax=Serratia quinivorans TaxID=137545 RepID=UPI00217AD72C|nr:RelA/SpoT domain-containing protein [Serratia quinivorans]CAI0905817.1 Guanosine polyphosphate pyrophosphohydrolases/synthetases [Serratia quinivorans]
MGNEQYKNGKRVLSYTKSQVKKAGEAIRKNEGDINSAIDIIRDYRAAHLYPLTIIKNLIWKHSQKINTRAVIARRLKRLPTIIDKLQRKTLDGVNPNTMSVTRMSDIGGCRVIVDNKNELLLLNDSLNRSRTTHSTKRIRDYLTEPKSTGYRGIHRIYDCYQNEQDHAWKGFNIEVQLRTKLQHLWATTIEVVDLCEGKTLKTNPFEAEPKWSEFFYIMSEFLAEEDGFIIMDNKKKQTYKERLLTLNDAIGAYGKLASFKAVFSKKEIEEKYAKMSLAVLVINDKERRVKFTFYPEKSKHIAIRHYNDAEGDISNNVLLVQMDDIKNLKAAYPNYIIDTTEFLKKFSIYTLSTYWTNPKPHR